MNHVIVKEHGPIPLPAFTVEAAVRSALAEDLGLLGDLTTEATVPASARAVGVIAARKAGTVCGLDFAEASFRALDHDVVFDRLAADGTAVAANGEIARITGNARALLTGERVALNFMGRLSGIASLTRLYTGAIAGTGCTIVDTRKTTPGLRMFEKYAVRCGGGGNHRAGLFDAVLIKDNHIVAAGGIGRAIDAARAHAGHMVKIEVEVDTIEQLRSILDTRIDAVLLDNMSLDELRAAVQLVARRFVIEASGGVSLQTVRSIAETGVDIISVGALTHSAPVLDLGLDFESNPAGAG